MVKPLYHKAWEVLNFHLSLQYESEFAENFFMTLPKRKSNRLKNYDYSQNGAYFITICVQDRKPILSRIPVGEGLAPPEPVLLSFGKIAQKQLLDLQNRYRNISVDRYVIMPNHIHILMRLDTAGRASPSPTTVSDIVRVFKSLTTRECRKVSSIEKLFQRSFYDHIIRDEYDYQTKWQYIDENPAKWCEDSLYVE